MEAFPRERERERESKRRLRHIFNNIISVENLLAAWREFSRGKKKRQDVAGFFLNLTDNIIGLHLELREKTYRHGGYQAFKINDPKPRDIHKASVRDRLVHHALYRILYPYFDKKFIFNSFSCRRGKGTRRALNRFREYGRIVSKNQTRTTWVLKGDIRKFFASIDHDILSEILKRQIKDSNTLWLLNEVIGSFQTKDRPGAGLPLGNLTSQLLVNIYLNEFDQFVKRQLKVRYYIRYADDFIILTDDKIYLERLIKPINDFLSIKLKLTLHPDKVFIKTLASGMDFLGWVNFPFCRVLRTATKKRMFRGIKLKKGNKKTIQSYLGLLSHGNAKKLAQKIVKIAYNS